MNRRHLAPALVGLALLAWWLVSRPQASAAADGAIDWSLAPLQEPTDREPFTVETRHGAVELVPRAAYDVSALVMSAERYRFDESAFLSPLDLALAWGEAAEPRVRDALAIYQGGRFYTWSTRDASLDLDRLVPQMANVHVVPATDNVRRALLALDGGDAVRLAGLLVDARGDDGFRWKTSLERGDDGAGACELLWVEEVQVGGDVYR